MFKIHIAWFKMLLPNINTKMILVFFAFVKFQVILLQKYRVKFNNISSLPKFGLFVCLFI